MLHQSVADHSIKEDSNSVLDFDSWPDVRSRVRYILSSIVGQARENISRIEWRVFFCLEP